MLGFARVVLMLLAVETVLYWCLWRYIRAARTERLEREWRDQGGRGEPRAYIRPRLEAGDARLRRWLLLTVYVIPTSVVFLLIYLTNSR